MPKHMYQVNSSTEVCIVGRLRTFAHVLAIGKVEYVMKPKDGVGINSKGGLCGIPVVNITISLSEKLNEVALTCIVPLPPIEYNNIIY